MSHEKEQSNTHNLWITSFWMLVTWAVIVCLGLLSVPTFAASAESSSPALGKTYPIAEQDFLTVIQQKLQAKADSGEIAALQQQMVYTVRHRIENPQPIAGIQTATAAATHYYDPSVTAPQDIHDADGNIIVKAGTTINPLSYLGLSKLLLFIDGRDAKQVIWAKQQTQASSKPVKVILVAGSYMALMRQWKQPVYFDQAGALTQRLGITAVPAKVWQESPNDARLRIDTIPIGGTDAR